MSRRIALLGLVAACAMAFSAVAASGALAAPEVSNTAFTCVEVATNTGEFTNAHCSSKTETEGEPPHLKPKNWSHSAIAVNTSTQLTLTNLNNPVLETVIAGSETILTATGAECVECMGENHEEVIEKEGKKITVMDVTGSGGHIRFTGVTTNLPSCTVVGGEVNTVPLKVTTTNTTTALLEPVSGTTMAEVHLNSGCVIGPLITVTGIARGTAKGATVTFNTGANELKVGKQTAFLKGEATIKAGLTATAKEKEEGKSPVHNPVSLTAA